MTCFLLQDTARRIAKVSMEAKLNVNEEDYLESFKPHMMDVVHAWCNGSSFAQICKMTDVFEGKDFCKEDYQVEVIWLNSCLLYSQC